MKHFGIGLAVLVACCSLGFIANAEESDSVKAKHITAEDGHKTQEGAKEQDGRWVLPDGSPTYWVGADGKLDWAAYSGFRRYNAECFQCHGFDGNGGSFAPALKESLKKMSYADFLGTVASGRINDQAGTEFVMPALGDNKNVMCYIDDIYTYLKGRSAEVIPPGRPAGRLDKPQAARDREAACLE